MKKSIFGFILAILLICPFMSQVLRAEARDTDSKVTDADKIFYYSFDNISGGLIADEWGSRNAVISGGKISTGKSGSALEVEKNTTGASVSNASVTNDAWTVSYWVYSKALSERSSVLMSSDGKYSFDAAISSSNLKSGVHVGTGSGDVLTFQYTLPAETWVHMTWTQDKTNGLSLYVNGTFVQTNTWTKTNNFPCPADLFGGSGFEGKIDELKIYNRVLTENEILAGMMGKGLNISETKKELKVGENWQIVTNLISDQEDKTITYTSSNPEIAAVSEDGTVQAKKRGTTQIFVKNAASGYEETVEISVIKEITIHNTVPVYKLDDSKLSDIDKDETNAQGRRYLGQPDMVMLDDNRTLITVYPVGHGHGKLVMKVSEDAGETWTEKTDIPSSWTKSLETPTIYKLHLDNGTTRLMLITGLPNWGNGETDANGHIGGWNTSYSDDGGKTWSEYKNWHEKKKDGTTNYTIVAMASLIQLKDKNGNNIQKWMGVYHDVNYVNYKTYLTFDESGNEQWSDPEPYLNEYRTTESKYQMCEIGMFRSPDGKRIVGLARSQSHNNPSTLIYSDDEGETWSEPMDLPGSLAGERHKALCDPISGKLVITFREIQYDLNKNNQFDGGNDWMAGDWVAWVGTYEDLMEQNDGQCHILLCEDWANNRYSGDTGYTGMVVLPDGTFVMDSYGHWDKEFSQSWQGSDGSGYNVKTDLCYIKQAKFKLADVIGESIVAVKDVMLNPSEVKLTEKGQTVQLTATVAPENTTVDGNKTATCSVTVEIPKDPTPDPDPKPEPNPTPNPTPTPDPTPTPTPSVPDKQEPTPDSTMTVGSEQKTGKGVYRITGTGSKRTVTFVKPINDKNTSFNVPASVKLADGRYKVTAIDKNAFKNNKKLKKVTIGSKVTRIGAGAFSGAKNLKAITIKSKSLKSVGKNALKGIHKKCTIKVPKTKLTAYKRLLKKKGQKASVKIIK